MSDPLIKVVNGELRELSVADIAAREALAAETAIVAPEIARINTFKSDASRADLLARLKNATPAQIDAFVDNNVTTLAQVRGLLKALLKLVATDARG